MEPPPQPFRYNLDPISATVYLGLHVGCFLVFFSNCQQGMLICITSYFVRIFALSVVYHRYFAHRSYRTSRVFQFILGLFGTLTVQRGPLWWAATHRAHHRHADRPRDLHAPYYHGFFYAHSLWFLDKRNLITDLRMVKDLAVFPELRLLDDQRLYMLVVGFYAIALYYLFGLTGLAWGFFVSTVWIHHTTHWVQSMSHSIGGYRRFDTPDRSRNHWLIGVLSLGEFHNNHHFRPSSARQGVVWWEVDIGFVLLRVLSICGLIWSLKDLFAEPNKIPPGSSHQQSGSSSV